MIRDATIAEVERLLAEGTNSQRRIARIAGVSRGTVGAIARGKYVGRPPSRLRTGCDPFAVCGSPARCPGCGGKVDMPCRLCHVRALPNAVLLEFKRCDSHAPGWRAWPTAAPGPSTLDPPVIYP